jgi:hypothetical protein
MYFPSSLVESLRKKEVACWPQDAIIIFLEEFGYNYFALLFPTIVRVSVVQGMHQEVTLTDGQHNAVNVLLQRVRRKCRVKFGSKLRDTKQEDGKIGDVMEIFTFCSFTWYCLGS